MRSHAPCSGATHGLRLAILSAMGLHSILKKLKLKVPAPPPPPRHLCHFPPLVSFLSLLCTAPSRSQASGVKFSCHNVRHAFGFLPQEREMKLLLVGLDNAGKTTIVRFLALCCAMLQFWYLQPAAPSSGRCCRCCCRRRRASSSARE